jgi:CYTH domain-containing protein
MEIERKYLIEAKNLPNDLTSYPSKKMEQGYLCTEPVVRVRHEGDDYVLTYKSKGLMIREEHNLPLTPSAYDHLKSKIDGRLISKTRYFLPINNGLTIELDVFEGELAPLILAEVEFPSAEMAEAFTPPTWFGEDVTFQSIYHNNNLSKRN